MEVPPDVGGPLRSFLERKTVVGIIMGVICINSVFMAYEANFEVKHYNKPPPPILGMIELCFFCFYFLETFLKMICYRIYYFMGSDWKSNLLDLTILIASGLSLLTLVVPTANYQNLSWSRMLKLLRVLKALRVVKVMKEARSLRTILNSLACSLSTLFWSMTVVTLFLFMFSIFFVLQTASELNQLGETDSTKLLMEYFGGIWTSMITLLGATLGGMDWMDIYNVLKEFGALNSLVFLLCIIVVQVMIVNIITGMFVETAIESMEKTREQQALEHVKEERMQERDLHVFLDQIDSDGDGRLDAKEWEQMQHTPLAHSIFEIVGLRNYDACAYFDILSNVSADKKVNINEFVQGCMRLKGPASCFDTQTILLEMRRTNAVVKRLQDKA
jgi:uncharacterized membrane protein